MVLTQHMFPIWPCTSITLDVKRLVVKTELLNLTLFQICHQVFSSSIVLDDKHKQHSFSGTGLKTLFCSSGASKETKKKCIKNRLFVLKIIFVKLRLSLVWQGAIQCYYHLRLWGFCTKRVCINAVIKQRHICLITSQLFAKTLCLWESGQTF